MCALASNSHDAALASAPEQGFSRGAHGEVKLWHDVCDGRERKQHSGADGSRDGETWGGHRG
ncbi:hypothetical protein E4U43_000722 [Claviceps pusilla]|uniref:Uncharacterized protein n=1 Tax=Claviceps pusilla TaxID=123648 RepID=A0A9P7NB28_9HYPO|nr:hypothetical protein E4U43_000722 [Claviceps pusilla]